MSSKATKGKQLLKESANPKLPPAMMQSIVMGKPILTTDVLDMAGQARVDLYYYYVNNY
jgi:hypothetical protein